MKGDINSNNYPQCPYCKTTGYNHYSNCEIEFKKHQNDTKSTK